MSLLGLDDDEEPKKKEREKLAQKQLKKAERQAEETYKSSEVEVDGDIYEVKDAEVDFQEQLLRFELDGLTVKIHLPDPDE